MRAWLALREAGVEFEEVVVDIRRPQRFHNLAVIGRLSAAAQVPVLQVDGRTIFDSVAIMEFANDISGGRLLPVDRLDRARARSLMAWQHAGLSGICGRISFESAFYPLRRALTGDEEAEAARLFGCLEPLLSDSGGPHLFGEVSLADFALTPTVIRLARHSASTDGHPLTGLWMDRILRDPHVAEWMSVADALPHIWFDDYLVPGAPYEAAGLQASAGALVTAA